MSMREVERFSNDLKSKADLMAKIRPHATGLAAVVSMAAQHGYKFSLDDAKQFIKAKSPRPMSDKQLDALAGGATTVNSTVVAVTVSVTSGVSVTNVGAAAEAVAVISVVLV